MPGPKPPVREPVAKELFLDELRAGNSITAAAKVAGRPKPVFYKWRKQDTDFAAEWEDAIEAGTDLLEDECRRRATGYDEITYEGGIETRRVRKHSDTLLIFTLKARRPDKYRDNARVEHAGDGGGPIQIDLAGVKDELVARLARLATSQG